VEQPLHFPPRAAWSAGAEPSEASVRLGELLFNDPALSADGQVSCASCHRREGAFSDPGMPVSVGVEGRLGRRNSPPIQNLAWTPYFMWDGGINHLEVLPLAPITNPAEHDLSLWDFVRRADSRRRQEECAEQTQGHAAYLSSFGFFVFFFFSSLLPLRPEPSPTSSL
jgi:cytochrome c peroxidase